MAICIHYDDADNFASIHHWDDEVPMCNVGDVLIKDRHDLEHHYSAKEIIKVLRVVDPKASNWFYENVIVQTGSSCRAAFSETSDWVLSHLITHALPFEDYNLNPEEELMIMNAPVKATKKAEAKPAKEKVPTKSALEKWADATGNTMDSTIHFGADKEGKAYSKENCPKRGKSAERWQATYKEGMTLADYAKAGGRKDDLVWDTADHRKWVIVKK